MEAYKNQNQFLSTELLEMNQLRSDDLAVNKQLVQLVVMCLVVFSYICVWCYDVCTRVAMVIDWHSNPHVSIYVCVYN